jgi:hypothetical protein
MTSFVRVADNCKVVVDNNGIYHHYCAKCGPDMHNMRFVAEIGGVERVVTHQCKCGAYVTHHG